ncbi:MAG: hypothetical protein ACLU4J_18590 [Butyricimonas paravirosa]
MKLVPGERSCSRRKRTRVQLDDRGEEVTTTRDLEYDSGSLNVVNMIVVTLSRIRRMT